MKLIRKTASVGLCKNDSKDVRRWKRIAATFRRSYLLKGEFKSARKMNKIVRHMRKRDFKES